MKEKINIAELLKDCPKGMKLYSPLCGECRVLNIYDGLGFDVICGDDTVYNFSYDGRYNIMGECCIFPSKENRDWSTFKRPFMDGDIISNSRYIAIFYKFGKPEKCINSNVIYYHCWYNNKYIYTKFKAKIDFGIGTIEEYRLATEEEKQKLFDVIKANGYKWNVETKTLEKLIVPKFKVGDRIRHKILNFTHRIMDIKDEYYIINETSLPHGLLPIEVQDHFELVPNKFDITTLKPFDKVLIRDDNEQKWTVDMFSFYDKKLMYPFVCVGHYTNQCIPYKDNEHLLGTTNDCNDYYKTWK